MAGIRADRVFYHIFLLPVTVLTLYLIWQFIGSVILAVIGAVVLFPMHQWYRRRTGNRGGLATALTLLTTLVLSIVAIAVAQGHCDRSAHGSGRHASYRAVDRARDHSIDLADAANVASGMAVEEGL